MKLIKRIAALVITLSVVGATILAVPSFADNNIDNATIKSYEQQLAANAEKQAAYLNELKKLQSEQASILEQKKAIDKAIETTAAQKVTVQNIIDELVVQLEELDKKEEEILKEIEKRRQAFLNRMAAMQEDGNVSYLELVLTADSISTFITRLDYVNSMLEYDKQVIADLKASKQRLEETRTEKQTSLKTQQVALEQLEAEEKTFQSLLAEQEKNVAAINADVKAQQQMIDAAAREEDKLQASIAAEEAEIRRQQELLKQQEEQNKQNNPQKPVNPGIPNVYADGAFIWPLQTGYISSHFGYRNLYGSQDYHAATDIAASTGTPIYASNSGTVIRSEWHDSYGNYVLIDHGNGITTLYAHMSLRQVKAGQVVGKGEYIGDVGNTGYSFGSHLHFEYRINGQRVDPEKHVKR